MKNNCIRQRRPFAALLVLLGMAFSFAAKPSFAATPNYSLGADVDGWAFDSRSRTLTYYPSPSAGACRASCQNNPSCAAYSWVKPGGFRVGEPPVCYLVATAGPAVRTSCCISASKSAMTTDQPPGGTGGNGLGVDVDGWTFDSRSRTLGYYQSSSAASCRSNCQNNPNCAAYSWVKPGGYRAGDPPVCYLIATAGPVVRSTCCISASKSAMTTDPPPPQNPGATGILGNWRHTIACSTYSINGVIQITRSGNGGYAGSVSAAGGKWGNAAAPDIQDIMQQGATLLFTLHNGDGVSNWSHKGQINGARVDGRVERYQDFSVAEVCSFTMTRQ